MTTDNRTVKVYFCMNWAALSQLEIYGKKNATMFVPCGVLQFFSDSEPTTLSWIERRLGQTTVVKLTEQKVTYDAKTKDGSTGISRSVESHPLLTAKEASRFLGRDDSQTRQLIIRPSYRPMILQRPCYYEEPRYAEQWDAIPEDDA